MTTNLQRKIKSSDTRNLLDTVNPTINTNFAPEYNTNNYHVLEHKQMKCYDEINPHSNTTRAQTNKRNRLLNTNIAEEQKQSEIIVVQHGDNQTDIIIKPTPRVFERGLTKIWYLRLVRYIHELKETNFSLIEAIKQQEQHFKQQKQRWSSQLMVLCQKMQQRDEITKISAQSKLDELQTAVKLRDQLIVELNKMINNLKQDLLKTQQKESNIVTTCSNCSLLEIKLNSVKEEAVAMAKKEAKLVEQYEALQEKLFDLEQQVVGIELEVERRLKQALQSIPQLSFYNQTNQQIIDSMNRQNQTLRAKCERYQKFIRDEQSLKSKQQQLRAIEKQYQLKNQALLEAIARNENVIQLSYEREHHLLLAEENLSKKIEELQKKEAELSQWENNITKDHSVKKNYNAYLDTFGRSHRPIGQAEAEEQPSLRSFGNHPQNYEITNYNTNFSQVLNKKIENVQGEVYIPMLALHNQQQQNEETEINLNYITQKTRKYELNHPKSKKSLNKNNQKAITESAYAYRSPYIMEKTKHTASNNNFHVRSPAARQNTYGQPSIQGSRIKSIGNRSVSRQSPSPIKAHNAQPYVSNNPKYSGIQNKLDRLRIELRKEIESIK